MSKRTPRTRKDPHAIAAQAADEYIAALTQHHDLGAAFDEMKTPIDDAIEQISKVLEAEHVRAKGPITPDDDLSRWDIGVRAGYLIGVQVGLRLRSEAR